MRRVLICFSNIDWGFLYQRHQHLMNGLAKENFFDKIIFVETLGIRNLRISDYKRIIQKLRKTTNGVIIKNLNINSKIIIHSPTFIPFHNKIAYMINFHLLKKQLKKYINEDDELYIWDFLAHPVIEKMIEYLKPRLFIFDCIDDLKSFKHVNKNVLQSEKILLKKADIVYCTSLTLLDFAKKFNKNSFLLRNAVDFDHFSNNIDFCLLNELKKKYKKKVIGYFGAIYEWFDAKLVEKLALEFEDCDIVIIGPAKIDISGLKRYPNVHFEGVIDYTLLPSYLKIFSVGIIPFKINELTKNTNPVKLYEYFSAGIPVVATYMPELEEYKDLVYLSQTHEEFLVNMRRSLNEVASSDISVKRVEVSKSNTWSNRINTVMKTLKELN